tara:strand:- start:39028 stop:40191 length:1164 start_codon:yes stop_codon:yes gene_type:complete
MNGNEVSFHLVPQTTATSGLPSTPAWQEMRRVNGDFDKSRELTQSNEIDSTGQAPKYAPTASSVQGSFDDEFPIADLPTRLILASVLRGSFSADLAISATTIAATATGFTDSANGFGSVAVGDYIKLGGLTDTTDNRVFKVTASAVGVIATSPAPNSTETASATITIKGSRLSSGIAQSAFGIQKRKPYAGGTVFETYQGVQFGNFAVNITASSLVTISYTTVGLNQVAGTGQIAGATDTAASSADITSSVTDVSYWFEGAPAVVTTLNYLDTSFTLDNGLSGINIIGLEGAGTLQHNPISVNGSLTSIASDDTEKQRFLNNTRFNIGMQITDADGNVLVFDFPQALYTALPQANNGNGEIFQNSGTFGAEKSDTTAKTVTVHYIAA